MSILKSLFKRIAPTDTRALEEAAVRRPGALPASPVSPERFDIERRMFESETVGLLAKLRMLLSAARVGPAIDRGISESFRSADANPPEPREIAEPGFLEDFEVRARELGIGSVGYALLPREAIFKDKAVPFENVVVLSMEMNRARIDQAPSRETLREVLETYRDLGRAANRLAQHLREHGYGAQAGHPLNGLALYPLLGQRAGLGWHGRHGMVITPEHGPRHRLAAIYTSIENLPFCEDNEHRWIEDFCAQCGRCVRTCPAEAILETPIAHKSAVITHVDSEKCFVEFARNYGCSVCIKECTFHRHPYGELQRKFFAGSRGDT